jgi:hypothetical protein
MGVSRDCDALVKETENRGQHQDTSETRANVSENNTLPRGTQMLFGSEAWGLLYSRGMVKGR